MTPPTLCNIVTQWHHDEIRLSLLNAIESWLATMLNLLLLARMQQAFKIEHY